MASIPDLTEQIKVYETKAYLIVVYPMLQYLLKWVGERQCTNCAQKLKWKGHFSFGSTPNHKSWTAIARLLFLIRDLLHNSLTPQHQREQQITKKKMDTPLLDLSWDNQFLDLLWCKYIQYTYYVCIRQRLFEPAPRGLQTLQQSCLFGCVSFLCDGGISSQRTAAAVLCNQALPEQGKKQVQLQWVISP